MADLDMAQSTCNSWQLHAIPRVVTEETCRSRATCGLMT